jgi:hypothetical protein
VAFAWLAVFPDLGAAQSGAPSRPFKPLYQEDASSAPKQSFLLAWSAYEGRGEDLGGRDEFASGSGVEQGRFYTGGQLGVAYVRRGRRVLFSADAAGSARYYPDLRQVLTQGHRAGASAELRLGRSRIQAGGTYRDTPYQQFLPQLGEEGLSSRAISADTAMASTQNTVQTATASWARAVGRRSELAFNYGFTAARSSSGVNQDTQQGGGAFRYRIGRDLDLRLGHQARLMRDVVNRAAPDVIVHDLDLGVDFERELSFSRRTRLAFTSGGSIVKSEQARHYVATGSATLKREIGRSWNAVAMYDRKVDVVEGFSQPVLADTIMAGVGGYWSRRFGTTFRAAVGRGEVGLESRAAYTSFATEARGNLILFRGCQWYVEHFYYQHAASGGTLPPGIPSHVHRRGIRTGLDVRFDAFGRNRR